MLREKIHIVITIVAALIISIASLFSDNDFQAHLVWVIITIIVFYFIGLIIKNYLNKSVFTKAEPEIEQEKEQDESGL